MPRMLSKGDKGEDVRNPQRALNVRLSERQFRTRRQRPFRRSDK